MKAKAAKSIWIMSFELDRIEELCNDRGWSHYRLAKEMEISPNSIGNLFRRTTVPKFLRRTVMKFGCDWRKIGHKGRCRKDSERTSKFSRRSCVRTGYPSFTFLCRSPVRLFHGTLLPPDEGFHLTAGQDRSLPVPVPP